jgi:putative peptide zinc metalloprotease protein
MSASYQARVPLHDFDARLLPGFRGRAKIHTPSRSLGSVFVRYLFKTFRFG